MYTTIRSLAVASTKPHTTITGSVSVRIDLYDILFGVTNTPPDDQVFDLDVRRCTDKGSGGNDGSGAIGTTKPIANAEPTYVAGGAAGTVWYGTWSVDPTKSSIPLLMCVFNQRASFRFPLLPGHCLEGVHAADDGWLVWCNANPSSNTVKINPFWQAVS